ncbi:hypothetical protein HOH67_01865 [Candidatus Peregrinibacteria bacterium]|jgi:hypothetical protein|nr:hypothetical protein [Candidatus Peregrinibacteria bacterium]MBT5823856.1 hypothetical protein [Candidatus Peregrinibacteria bacterium]
MGLWLDLDGEYMTSSEGLPAVNPNPPARLTLEQELRFLRCYYDPDQPVRDRIAELRALLNPNND